jgi:hypothetical protein
MASSFVDPQDNLGSRSIDWPNNKGLDTSTLSSQGISKVEAVISGPYHEHKNCVLLYGVLEGGRKVIRPIGGPWVGDAPLSSAHLVWFATTAERFQGRATPGMQSILGKRKYFIPKRIFKNLAWRQMADTYSGYEKVREAQREAPVLELQVDNLESLVDNFKPTGDVLFPAVLDLGMFQEARPESNKDLARELYLKPAAPVDVSNCLVSDGTLFALAGWKGNPRIPQDTARTLHDLHKVSYAKKE